LTVSNLFDTLDPKKDTAKGGTPMITFEYRFDILPGKTDAYEKYVKGQGKNIWTKFRGVKAVRKYKSMLGGSSPQRVVQVDLESLATLEKILTDPGFRRAKEKFHGLVTHVSDSLLVSI
jgi:hypothetical protein